MIDWWLILSSAPMTPVAGGAPEETFFPHHKQQLISAPNNQYRKGLFELQYKRLRTLAPMATPQWVKKPTPGWGLTGRMHSRPWLETGTLTLQSGRSIAPKLCLLKLLSATHPSPSEIKKNYLKRDIEITHFDFLKGESKATHRGATRFHHKTIPRTNEFLRVESLELSLHKY